MSKYKGVILTVEAVSQHLDAGMVAMLEQQGVLFDVEIENDEIGESTITYTAEQEDPKELGIAFPEYLVYVQNQVHNDELDFEFTCEEVTDED